MELILEKGQVILKPVYTTKKDWEKFLKKMSANVDDQLLMNDVFYDENLEE